MKVKGIKCPKCKQLIWPKKPNVPVLCFCGYCYIEYIQKEGSGHTRIGYGYPGQKMAEVPKYIDVNTDTGKGETE